MHKPTIEDLQCAKNILAEFAHTQPPADFMEERVTNHIAAHVAHIRSRFQWWMENAEAIAKERGELFRAGEAMHAALVERAWCEVERQAWDSAAQPIRDMLKDCTEKCESGCAMPVAGHDSDGVPLCQACIEDLNSEPEPTE